MAVIVVAFEGCFLDCAVHPLDLPVGPGVLDLGEPVFDPVLVAAQVAVGPLAYRSGGSKTGEAQRELDLIIGQHLVDFVGRCFDQRDQKG
jgi:hypothetical protein